MHIIIIIVVLISCSALCFYEIPKMVRGSMYRDLWAFCILLALGIAITIFKCLDLPLPNPSDWVAWVFSPVSDMLKNYLMQ